jgi:hypothetical protein
MRCRLTEEPTREWKGPQEMLGCRFSFQLTVVETT